MSCQKHKELLERWWNDQLTAAERAELAAQLAECEDCKREIEGSRELWDLMGYMPVPEPSGDMQSQFNAMLDNYKASEEGKSRPGAGAWASLWALFGSRPGMTVAFSLLLLVGGVALGMLMRKPEKPAIVAQNPVRDTVYIAQAPPQKAAETITTTRQPEKPDSAAKLVADHRQLAEARKLDELTAQVHEMREMMMLSMLQNPAASERIKAVSYTNEIQHADPNVVTALLTTLDNDPNVNVRLTTLEALTHYAGDPAIREGLVKSILQQQSPLVQAALADVMMKLQEKRAIDPFKKLLEQKDLNETVRTKIEATIFRLT